MNLHEKCMNTFYEEEMLQVEGQIQAFIVYFITVSAKLDC